MITDWLTIFPPAEIAGYDNRSVAVTAGIIVGAIILLWLMLKVWKLLLGILILAIIAIAAKLFFYWLGNRL